MNSEPPKVGSRSILPWIFCALLLAGVSYVFTTRRTPDGDSTARLANVADLPESYGLCAEPGKIYTVDVKHPNVDCILVRKDTILATGTRGKFQLPPLYFNIAHVV